MAFSNRAEQDPAFDAAYRLGGDEALFQLVLETSKTVGCPPCERWGVNRSDTAPRSWATRHQSPEAAAGVCNTCFGRGQITPAHAKSRLDPTPVEVRLKQGKL